MSSTEQKLKEYRKRKETERRRAEQKEILYYFLSLHWLKEMILPSPQEQSKSAKVQPEEEEEEGEEVEPEQSETGFMFWYYFGLKLVLWVVLQAIFIELEFGSVFFVASCLYFMYKSMGRRRKGEASAYSVFNPGCEAIDGTLTAQQFENEIRHRNVN